jgi:small subunit ribosomal protein S8
MDPIADMLTRIRNASRVKKSEVIFPFSKIKFSIAKILEEEGFVGKVERKGKDDSEISVILKYKENNGPVIASLKRISKPGCRIYVTKDKLPKVLGNLGIAIISTSQGIMTNKEARKKSLGGEVLCEIC